jgi:hypothetical protein
LSHNPYAPPRADLGSEPAATVGGRGDFSIGQCLSEGWTNTWANFPLWLGALLVWTLSSMLAAATILGLFLVVPVLMWGLTLFALRMHDGGASFGDLFAGFSRYGRALGSMIACFTGLLLVGLAGQSIQIAGTVAGSDALTAAGMLVNVLVAILITPRLNLAYLYVVDQDEAGFDSLRRAWDETARPKWKVVGLALLSGVVVLAGALVLLVGALPASVMAGLMWVSAYRQIAGSPAAD